MKTYATILRGVMIHEYVQIHLFIMHITHRLVLLRVLHWVTKEPKAGWVLNSASRLDQNVYIGLQSRDGDNYQALPFYEASEDESSRYDVEKLDNGDTCVDNSDQSSTTSYYGFSTMKILPVNLPQVRIRGLLENLTFRIYSPVRPVPDPTNGDREELMDALVPAVLVEMTIDNTEGQQSRKAYFGYQGNDPYSAMRLIGGPEGGSITGVGQGRLTAIMSADDGLWPARGFTLEKLLQEKHRENLAFGLGSTAALLMEVPAGEKRTYQFAVCFYRGGIVTTGMDTTYWYTRYFSDIQVQQESMHYNALVS